jgi:lipopolysaccharide transport system permease protein
MRTPIPPTWDLIIQPKRHLFDINLRELWEYRDLIILLVRRDFVAKYKQTILGPLWFIIQPLFTTLIYTVIFGKVAGISTEGMPGVLFYLSGIVLWTYFAQSLTLTSNTFVMNAGIFGKVYFPRLAIPISTVVSNLILLAIQFSLFLIVLIYLALKGTEIHPDWGRMWFFPVLILITALLSLGFGIIISSLTTKYRDLTHLVKFGVQLWMYATPVIYPLSEISSPRYQKLILLNPLSSLVEAFRELFLGVGSFQWNFIGYSALFALGVMIIGLILFNRIEKNFMDTV